MPRAPTISQGRRRPKRLVERSEMRPPRALKMTAASAPGATAKAVIEAASAGLLASWLALIWIDTVAGPIRAMKMPSWPSMIPSTNHQGRGLSKAIPRCGIGSFGPIRFGLPTGSIVGSGANPEAGACVLTRTPSSGRGPPSALLCGIVAWPCRTLLVDAF